MPRKSEVKKNYFNRELSWLAFNRRVLNLCSEPTFPLLERMRFLSIVSNNLDEFFEIRVAGLEQQLESGVIEVGFDGLGPREQLRRISVITSAMTADEYSCWTDTLVPELKKEKIFFKTPRQCSAQEKRWLKKYFEDNVDFYIDGGQSEIGLASTIVQVIDGKPQILRQGSITLEQINEIL